MTLSVLICTYNRHELLDKALAAIFKSQTLPDQVVVVNGGDEQADQVASKYSQTYSFVKLVKTKNVNLAVSRNIGLPYCTGDIVALTDDDAQVFPDWVARMKAAHRAHPEAGGIGGAVIGLDHTSMISRVADKVTFPSFPTPRYVRTLPGVNISYKREVIERAGPYDAQLFRGEDVDYNWRILKLGYKIYYDPAIRVYHWHRPSWHGLFHQHYMYGRAYYLVRGKWKDMYCVYPHQFQRMKDFLKLGNFFASILYEPLLISWRMERRQDRLPSFPIVVANHIFWKLGMIRQALKIRMKDEG